MRFLNRLYPNFPTGPAESPAPRVARRRAWAGRLRATLLVAPCLFVAASLAVAEDVPDDPAARSPEQHRQTAPVRH